MTDSSDFEAGAAFWNAYYPSAFRLDADTLRRHTTESICYVAEGSYFQQGSYGGKALVVLKTNGARRHWTGDATETGHLAAYASTDIANHDLSDISGYPQTLEIARRLGIRRLTFGMDPNHLLPGCPEEMAGLQAELAAVGFAETGRCFDLERDLLDYELPDECDRALHDHRASVRPCSPQDRDALDSYFALVFPGRWRYDVMRKHGEEPDQIYVLEIDGQILGHAMTQQDGCRRPVAGAVWHLSLGEDWGALGSIGIDSAIRGKGLGNALLGKALQNLQARGARQTIIDWTTLGDFYGAHGFGVTRRYVQMALDLTL